MITSIQNPKIQLIRDLLAQKKQRDQANSFVVEGIRLSEEALAADLQPSLVIYSSKVSDRGKQLILKLDVKRTQIEEVDPTLLDRISDTETSQGLLMVFEKPQIQLSDFNEPILVLDQMRDPGNLGTILRCAAAFGFKAVLLTSGSADPFSPKVLRSGMGAQFKIPVVFTSAREIQQICRERNIKIRLVLADAGATQVCWDFDLSQPLCLIIGSEASGAGSEIVDIVDECVLIPMQSNNESLNAAMAACILLYEVQRQRSLK